MEISSSGRYVPSTHAYMPEMSRLLFVRIKEWIKEWQSIFTKTDRYEGRWEIAEIGVFAKLIIVANLRTEALI